MRGKRHVTEETEGNSEIKRNQREEKKKKPIRLLHGVVPFFVLFCYFLWPYYSKAIISGSAGTAVIDRCLSSVRALKT